MPCYYPLAAGNQWVYGQADGSTFTNTVTEEDPSVPGRFTMMNSMQGTPQFIRKEGGAYLTDSFEAGNFQVLLRDDLKPGDTWDIKFTANGIESVLAMTVKDAGCSMEIGGKRYGGVLVIEGESKMVFNGSLMPLNFFTRYHYAPGVGLVLTTSTGGVSMPLVSAGIVQG